jgi:hypothetical protein
VREFDAADVLRRNAQPLGKLLLGPPKLRPELGDSAPDRLLDTGRIGGTHRHKVGGTDRSKKHPDMIVYSQADPCTPREGLEIEAIMNPGFVCPSPRRSRVFSPPRWRQ